MSSPAAASAALGSKSGALRVMVVDDSIVIRGMISRWIDAEPDLTVAASLRTGREAVDQLQQCKPDIVVLDIEMPELDGISALPLLIRARPDLIVIMASTLTLRNAEISFKALALGASDYIPKPESTREAGAADTFKRDLLIKIRAFGAKLRRRPVLASPPLAPGLPAKPLTRSPPQPIQLRSFGLATPRALLIGSSTGGPQALLTLLPALVPIIDRVPVLITQHMPATFTTILAEHLSRVCGRRVREGVDGEAVKSGAVYLAPGGRHMTVAGRAGGVAIALDDGPTVNFCKPAVDPLFQSAITVWQSAVAAVVLTGMGSDGMRGGGDIANAGGSVIAQDEATSVVWGMPGSTAQAGVCAAVLPLAMIGPKLVRLFSGDRA